MIHFYVGKPRNGKSLRVMMKIIEVLTKTQQHVVTNMVVRLDVLQEYLDTHGYDIHVIDRVTLIDDDQTRDFWLYRSDEYKLPTPEGYGDKKDKDPENISYRPLFEDAGWRVGGKLFKEDGSPADFKGTCYVIDEVQNLWPARGWQGTGHHIAFYLSQHGKLGDTVFFITQNVKNVDRLLYSVAQDFTYCRNHRMEKHGRFRGENKFTAKTYPGPVQDGNEVTLNVEDFKLDLEIAACYDTSAGVGMPGGGTADAGFRAKGIPLKMVWVSLAAVLVFCWAFFTYGLPRFTNRFLAPAINPAAVNKSFSLASVSKTTRASIDSNVGEQSIRQGPPAPQIIAYWESSGAWGTVVHVNLSNGVTIPPREIEAYNMGEGEEWVQWQGRRFYMAKPKIRPMPADNTAKYAQKD